VIKWSTTDKEGLVHGVKLLVYGGAGAGKTFLCQTAPNPFIISAESGLLTLRKVSIPVVVIKTLDDLNEVYTWLTASQEAAQFYTICLDSISEIAEVLLASLMKDVGQKDPRKAFGELVPKMASIIRSFRDLPNKNVFMTAKMEPIKDEMSGVVKYGPSMPGQKLGPQLPYFFDEVFRIGIAKDPQGNLYRFLQTQSDMQYDAKDRSGMLAQMEPPDLNVIFNKVVK
jgi:hypothetical protein